ncbi:hypothetical protein D1872_79000 [compost metagenome]
MGQIFKKYMQFISQKSGFITMLVVAAILGGITYYLNLIIPKPETFSVLLTYLWNDPKTYVMTCILNLVTFVIVFIAGVSIVFVSYASYVNDEYELETIGKIALIVASLFGVAISIFSIAEYFMYFGKLITIIIALAIAIYIAFWLITNKD